MFTSASWKARKTHSYIFLLALASLAGFAEVHADRSIEDAFTDIYKNKTWGTNSNGEGHSGGGSTLESTQIYREFLQGFLQAYQITSVVDVGCGDWEFSQWINWDGISYTGYDVVQSLVDKNQAKYGTPNIQFYHSDGSTKNIIGGDLLICKDVLQHLPNDDIFAFLSQLNKFKFCLITNDLNSGANQNTFRGGYRSLDLTMPPFNLKALKVLSYNCMGMTKLVLLVDNRIPSEKE